MMISQKICSYNISIIFKKLPYSSFLSVFHNIIITFCSYLFHIILTFFLLAGNVSTSSHSHPLGMKTTVSSITHHMTNCTNICNSIMEFLLEPDTLLGNDELHNQSVFVTRVILEAAVYVTCNKCICKHTLYVLQYLTLSNKAINMKMKISA